MGEVCASEERRVELLLLWSPCCWNFWAPWEEEGDELLLAVQQGRGAAVVCESWSLGEGEQRRCAGKKGAMAGASGCIPEQGVGPRENCSLLLLLAGGRRRGHASACWAGVRPWATASSLPWGSFSAPRKKEQGRQLTARHGGEHGSLLLRQEQRRKKAVRERKRKGRRREWRLEIFEGWEWKISK
jgi:hypothetical protein